MKITTGKLHTAGFVAHRIHNGSVCIYTGGGCGVRGYGCGVQNADPRYTPDQPYL